MAVRQCGKLDFNQLGSKKYILEHDIFCKTLKEDKKEAEVQHGRRVIWTLLFSCIYYRLGSIYLATKIKKFSRKSRPKTWRIQIFGGKANKVNLNYQKYN